MVIGIDGNEANIKERVGVNQYAFKLLHNFKKLQDEGNTKHQFVIYLKNQPLDDMPKENQSWNYKVLGGGGKWIITKLMPQLYRDRAKIDVFFTPSHYLPIFAPMPMACSIMDLGYLEFSEQFTKKDFWQLKLWTARSIYVAKKVFAISEATKKDIVRHYKNTQEKTVVTYLSYDKDVYNLKRNESDVRRIKNKYTMSQDYILFLSTLKPNKNIEGLVKAFSLITNKYKNIKLVIAGKKGWLYKTIYEQVEKLNLKKEVIFTGFVDEKDKPNLIKGAKIFALPSYWEGFGLDVLSALACGVPVIVSDRGSLPEVAGKSSFIVDPDNVGEIADAINKILNMPKKEYNKLVSDGVLQASKFSWEKTAKKTLETLEKI